MDIAHAAAHAASFAIEVEVAGGEFFGDPLGRLRLSKARTRAISSGSENGLTT